MNNIEMNIVAKLGYYCHFNDFTFYCFNPDLNHFKSFLKEYSTLAGFGKEFVSWQDPNVMSRVDEVATKNGWFGVYSYQYDKTMLRPSVEFDNGSVGTARDLLAALRVKGYEKSPETPTHLFPETTQCDSTEPEIVNNIVYITIGKLYKFLGYEFTPICDLREAPFILSQFIKMWNDRLKHGIPFQVPLPNVAHKNNPFRRKLIENLEIEVMRARQRMVRKLNTIKDVAT